VADRDKKSRPSFQRRFSPEKRPGLLRGNAEEPGAKEAIAGESVNPSYRGLEGRLRHVLGILFVERVVKPIYEFHEDRPDDRKKRGPGACLSLLASLSEPLDFGQLRVDPCPAQPRLYQDWRWLSFPVAATERVGKDGNGGMHYHLLRSQRQEESFNFIQRQTCVGLI
jgi:hypothetical protein